MFSALMLCVSILTQLRGSSPSELVCNVTLTGQVVTTHVSCIVLKTKSASFDIYQKEHARFNVGDRVIATCAFARGTFGRQLLVLKDLVVCGHDSIAAPRFCSIDQLLDEKPFLEHVRIRGKVSDIAFDEVDHRYLRAIVHTANGRRSLNLSLGPYEPNDQNRAYGLLHAEIEATGVFLKSMPSSRGLAGPLFIPDDKNAISVITPASDNDFDLPQLVICDTQDPSELTAMGRRTLRGRVVAAWGNRDFILQTENVPYRGFHHVELALGAPLPRPGSEVLVAGQPETDTYRINLSCATYRTVSSPQKLPDACADVNVRDDLFLNGEYQPDCYGYIVRLQGRILSLPRAGDADIRLHVDVAGIETAVDVSACPEVLDSLQIGGQVEVTGACLLESDNWRPNAPLPKIRGVVIVTRRPRDIRILSRPPWWTVGRLTVLIAGLVVFLILILVWNRVLGRLIVRRSRELLREQLARNASELRIGERTRLAVELHDTISQNLIGVACQITAARNSVGKEDDLVRQRLIAAELTLKACRTELRQILSDLRNRALEATDMTSAIRTVLKPLDESAKITVRFNVPRQRLLDTTAHAILCIIRELAGNAIRHGSATVIRIAGTLDRDRLMFSVRDNGRGFDIATSPGIQQGHFGLDGIRNRVARMRGSFSIDSSPAKGTHATVILTIPRPTQPQIEPA